MVRRAQCERTTKRLVREASEDRRDQFAEAYDRRNGTNTTAYVALLDWLVEVERISTALTLEAERAYARRQTKVGDFLSAVAAWTGRREWLDGPCSCGRCWGDALRRVADKRQKAEVEALENKKGGGDGNKRY